MSLKWEDCLNEGEKLFQYMIHHYDDMFDGEIIKHFNIWYATWWMQSYYREVNEICGKDIQLDLVPWIRNEFESKQLFKSSNWKPFRDGESPIYMNLGYKKLFFYKQYYFQLQIEATCSDCIHCEKKDNPIHFDLGLYGWKDEYSERVLPYKNTIILADLMMPESDWADDA